MRTIILSLISFFLSILTVSDAKNIGLCIMATGKYVSYAERFIESARKHFCKEDQVTYFVFTDQPLQNAKDVVRIEQKRLGWPYDTMMRFAVYYNNRDIFDKLDYIFASDADMLFVADVGSEMFSDRVATQHPGFIGKRGSYETNKISKAYINDNEGKYYFAGGFYGGSKNEFIKLCGTLSGNINIDLQKNFVAVWHDESHLNRYFVDNPPTKILSPSYCYPESWNLPYDKKLLALDKNHSEMRK